MWSKPSCASSLVVVRKIYCKFSTSTFSYSLNSLPAAGCVPHTLTHLPIPRWEGLYRSRQAHLAVRPPKRGAYDFTWRITVRVSICGAEY